MSEALPSITLKNLTSGYGDKVVTRDVNACLYDGALTCLLGSNGAGKSTLLRTICRLRPAISGEISIFGDNIDKIKPVDFSRLVSVVLTERLTSVNMDVFDLVAMGRSPYTGYWGRLSDNDRVIVTEAIDMVGISDLTHRRVHTLSDGERQKAMIAKALAQQTPIICLDEPTAFLDFKSKVGLMRLLRRIAVAQQKTVFMSTHDIELALHLADCLWLLAKDESLTVGTPASLSADGTISDFFLAPGIDFDSGHRTFCIQK